MHCLRIFRFVACAFLVSVFFQPLRAQTVTESVLYSGLNGPSALTQGADGNFYGTTNQGGGPNVGSVFRMSPSGGVTLLYSFCSLGNCADGRNPNPSSGLIQGVDGNFYGTTNGGGTGGNGSTLGPSGTVFKITPTGVLTTIYNFCTQIATNSSSTPYCADGTNPVGGLIFGNDGNLYGTTSGGGSGYGGNGGTVFKLTPAGVLTTLANFGSIASPEGPLVQGSDGNFYGTANSTPGFFYGPGGVFVVTPSSFITYDFTSGYLFGGLVEGADGNYYGTTESGGTNPGYGTVYEITPEGGLTNLQIFSDVAGTPSYPYSGLFLAGDGNFYGTTYEGGSSTSTLCSTGCGDAFQITQAGALTNLYSFCSQTNCADGYYPTTSLVQGADGNLYGTASGGSNVGVEWLAYKLTVSPALPPPVQLTFDSSTIALGSHAILNWQVNNAFSTTLQQCAAFVQNNVPNAGTWTGLQPGTFDSAISLYLGTATITPTASGTYTYALTCGGTETGFATLTVSRLASSAVVSATPDPLSVGQTLTLKGTVTGAGATPTGIITFYNGSAKVNAAVLSAGVGTYSASTNGLPAGSYLFTGDYSGDANYVASTSPGYSVVINKAPTSTTVVASPPTVVPPGKVLLTGTVTRSASGATGTPTGTVTFYFGTLSLGTATLNASGYGSIMAATTGVPAGKYGITAKYNGDANDVTSTSPAATVTVQ